MIISPTGKGIRSDSGGDGHYRAKRGNRLHGGTDYKCEPLQNVLAPISGIIEREARPYADGEWSGVVISNSDMKIKMFYFVPNPLKIGKHVDQGEVIGIAQDIGEKYKGVTPHIHLQIESIDPEILRR